jgi:hypothetical protein
MAVVALTGMFAGLLAGCSTTPPAPPGTLRARIESFSTAGGWHPFGTVTLPNRSMDVWIDLRQAHRVIARTHLAPTGVATLVVPAGTYGAVVVSKVPTTITPGTGPKYVPCQASRTVHVRSRHVTSVTLSCPYYNDGYRMYPTRPPVPAPGVPDSNGIAHP